MVDPFDTDLGLLCRNLSDMWSQVLQADPQPKIPWAGLQSGLDFKPITYANDLFFVSLWATESEHRYRRSITIFQDGVLIDVCLRVPSANGETTAPVNHWAHLATKIPSMGSQFGRFAGWDLSKSLRDLGMDKGQYWMSWSQDWSIGLEAILNMIREIDVALSSIGPLLPLEKSPDSQAEFAHLLFQAGW